MNSVEAALALASCQVPSAAGAGGAAPQGGPETIRVAEGRFPADLNRLRGQLSLEASVGEPVVVDLECGSAHVLIAACDDKDFYGTWNATQSTWTPAKADQLYGSAFSALIQDQVGAGSAATWKASFLAFPASAPDGGAEASAPAAAPAAAASGATKKKTVVRKRPLATPVVAAVAEESNKKAAPEVESDLDM